VNGQVVLKEA